MRITVMHHNPKRIQRRLTNTILAILDGMQRAAREGYGPLAGITGEIVFHYDPAGVPSYANGAYRKGVDGAHHIWVRQKVRNPAGLTHTIAHELRHAWQVEQGLLSTMAGKRWAWYDAQGNAVLCDGGDNDPSEVDANNAAADYCRQAW